ncbi:MAG: hypothetical protein ACTIKA_09710 [Psychroflexus halocasei]
MEKYIYLLIIIHASFGGIALIAGFIHSFLKKGKMFTVNQDLFLLWNDAFRNQCAYHFSFTKS